MRTALVCEVFHGKAVSPSWPCPNVPRSRIDVCEVRKWEARVAGKREERTCVLLLLTPVTGVWRTHCGTCECSPSDGSLEGPLHRLPTLFLTVSFLATPTLLQTTSQFTCTHRLCAQSVLVHNPRHIHSPTAFIPVESPLCFHWVLSLWKIYFGTNISFFKNMFNIIRGMSQYLASNWVCIWGHVKGGINSLEVHKRFGVSGLKFIWKKGVTVSLHNIWIV